MGSNASKRQKTDHNPRPSDAPPEYDYFKPELAYYCWADILKFINNPNDLQSLMNASPFFDDELAGRKIELVLPILIQQGYLPRTSILSSRLLSNETKRVVDNLLIEINPPWLASSFILSLPEEIDRFSAICAGFYLSSSFGSRYYFNIKTRTPAGFERLINLLQEHGRFVKHLSLEMFYERLPLPLLQGLVRVLRLVPNLLNLKLDFQQLFRTVPLPNPEGGDEDNLRLLEAEAANLPRLNFLWHLGLLGFSSIQNQGGRAVNYRLLEHILQVYGPQLSSLKTTEDVLGQGVSFQTCEDRLLRLRTLDTHLWEVDRDNSIFCKLTRCHWPQLSTIIFTGHIHISLNFLMALRRHRNTLKELRLQGTFNWDGVELQDLSPDDAWTFPKLRKLTVANSQFDHDIWQLFRNQFVNLKRLRLLPESRWEADQQRYVDVSRPPLDGIMLRRYFDMFPRKLAEVVWVEVKNGRNSVKDVVHTRASVI